MVPMTSDELQARAPKPRRFITRVRFSVRWLMVAVLVAGLICGAFADWRTRQLRRQRLIAQLGVQRQVTDSVIHQTIADIFKTRRPTGSAVPLTFDVSRRDSFGPDKWRAQVDAFELLDGRKISQLLVEVSGGCDGDTLWPITLKVSGASMDAQLLDELRRAYRSRGWQHKVVPLPAAGK
jgi:hypothetical protein